MVLRQNQISTTDIFELNYNPGDPCAPERLHQQLKDSHRRMLQYNFSHEFTGSISDHYLTSAQGLESSIESYMAEWRRGLRQKINFPFCYAGVLTFHGNRPHVHCLMFGRRKDGATLHDINPLYPMAAWPLGNAEFKALDDARGGLGGWIDYTVDKNSVPDNFVHLQPFNKGMLRQIRNKAEMVA